LDQASIGSLGANHRSRDHPSRRRPAARAERRMGGPESPLHVPWDHRPDRRWCCRQPGRHDRL